MPDRGSIARILVTAMIIFRFYAVQIAILAGTRDLEEKLRSDKSSRAKVGGKQQKEQG
jgi:hypothetical protein